MSETYQVNLAKWHEFVQSQGQKVALLSEILAEQVTFRSPVVWTPQEGKTITMRYLLAAVQVLEDFKYHRKFTGDNSVVLEFTARSGETIIKGIDIIQFNSENQIIDFEVMVRPARALQVLGAAMGERLAQKSLV